MNGIVGVCGCKRHRMTAYNPKMAQEKEMVRKVYTFTFSQLKPVLYVVVEYVLLFVPPMLPLYSTDNAH